MDYAHLSPADLLTVLGDDAVKWATAFNQISIALGFTRIDESWLTGWFANAIEHSTDVREARKKNQS